MQLGRLITQTSPLLHPQERILGQIAEWRERKDKESLVTHTASRPTLPGRRRNKRSENESRSQKPGDGQQPQKKRCCEFVFAHWRLERQNEEREQKERERWRKLEP